MPALTGTKQRPIYLLLVSEDSDDVVALQIDESGTHLDVYTKSNEEFWKKLVSIPILLVHSAINNYKEHN